MKKLHSLLLVSASLLMAACSSTYKPGSAVPDDVYYSTADQGQPAPAVATYPATQAAPAQEYSTDRNNYDQNTNYQDNGATSQPSSSSTDYYQDEKGSTYITNNYYNEDSYDYEYSARLKRYYSPAYGYGYYDPFYTNSYYYDYYPSSWGVSIYSSYNWWAPSYYYSTPFCYGGIGIGIGYSPIFNPWYSPWYYDRYYPGSYYHGYHHPYHGGYSSAYYNGYNHGYNDGYYGQGHSPYYYNSYDATSTYYGPRGASTSNSPRSTGRQSSLSPMSLGEKYQVAKQDGRITNNSSEGTRTNDSRDQNSGNSPARNKAQETNPDRNTPVTSPRGNGETRESIDQNPRQTPANSGETKPNTGNSIDNGRKQEQNIAKPTQGDVRTSDPVRKTEPVRTTPDARDTKTTPVRQNNNDSRNTPATNPQKNDSDQKSTQPARNTTPARTQPANTQPTNTQPQRQQETRPENKNTNPTPRRKEPEVMNNNGRDQQGNTQSMRINSERSGGQQIDPRAKQNTYTAPAPEKNNSKIATPRQDTRTPMVQPRNEPRQYKQENKSSSPQRSTTPAQSRPSNNDSKRSSSPRK